MPPSRRTFLAAGAVVRGGCCVAVPDLVCFSVRSRPCLGLTARGRISAGPGRSDPAVSIVVLATFAFPVRLEQFNAGLQRVADHPIRVALPTAMAVDSTGVLWVADYDAAKAWRLDPSSDARLPSVTGICRSTSRVFGPFVFSSA